MGHCFSHLTKADRYKIEALLNNGHSAKEIAAEIHVHISTIYREVKRARMVHRNSDWTEEERYNPDEAHRRYRENLSAKGAPLKIGRDYALAEYLERKVLEEGRSPAAALADIALEGLEFKTTICTSTFYGYITKGVFLMLSHDRKTILGNAVLRPFFLKIVYPIGIIQFQSLQSKKECDSYRFCHTPLNV